MSEAGKGKRRALLSVSDKTGLTELAQTLAACGFELVSTGGTAAHLRNAGLPVRDVAEVTGFPEMLAGRIKTLHPRVHGGLLGRVGHAGQRAEMRAQGIEPIEVVVVNLYPFERVAERAAGEAIARGELIENIDIGGPAMLRSAAKNFESVTVVCDPEDYSAVAQEIATQGGTGLETRWRLAQKAFRRTAAYDTAIAATLERLPAGRMDEEVKLEGGGLPATLRLDAPRRQSLRYGENPHQQAALYTDAATAGGLAHGVLLQGKELSYNNLVDLDAAWQLAAEFAVPAVAIIKHTNPAGCAAAGTLLAAYQRALACDPVSAFGGVIGVNRELDEETAAAIASLFVECIAAPGFSAGARARLAGKKNLRLVAVAPAPAGWQLRSISGGWLAQDADLELYPPGAPWRVATKRAPAPEEAAGLAFAWAVVKHVKSNAIVFARAEAGAAAGEAQTLAVGAGQMSRVDAVRIAGMRAQLPLAGSVMASDAFFPFPDSIEEAAKLGATAIIQPGGSVRDEEAVTACDRLGLAMVLTGMRHFRH
jgi:phosphoribosylaminoimidazolecarboxamide formyltransferase/IMP cyclohydrolase